MAGAVWRCIAFLLAFAIAVPSKTQQTALSQSGVAQTCIGKNTRQSVARGQFKQAEKELREALDSGQPCPEAHFLLAYDLLRQNLARPSLDEYTAAARLRTPTPEDLRNVALDYVHTLRLAPGSVKAENNLGLAYEGLNEADKANEAYRRAIAFGEQSGKPSEQPMINLAILLAHRSDLDGALTLLTRAVVLAPEDARAREHLGQVYFERNQLPQAQVQLEKAVSLSPADARLHFQLGQLYRREGDSDKAKVEFSRSASLNGAHSTPDHLN